MAELAPANPLEHGLANLRGGLIQMTDFLPTLIYAEIVVPSATEPQPEGGGITPMLYERNGIELVAAFTSGERVHAVVESIPHRLVIQGGEFLRRMSPVYGLILNPGWSLGMTLTPEGIRQIVDNLAESIWAS